MRFSLNKILNLVEELAFYFFLIAIPFQTRIILFQQDWYFSEWRSMSLYGLDLIWLGLMVLWLTRIKFKWQPKKSDWALMAFALVSLISIKNSSHAALSWYAWARLVQGISIFYYFRTYAWDRFSRQRSAIALVIGGGLQAAIATWQFQQQTDLGLRILGEPFLNVNLQGVAVFFNQAGQKILRVYGTTPHPNVLAAYLLIVLSAFYFLYLNYYSPKTGPSYPASRFWTSYIVLLAVFFLTFSRTIIAVWVLGFVILAVVIAHRYRLKLKMLLFMTAAVCLVFSLFFWRDIIGRLTIPAGDEAVSFRMYYNKTALSTGGHALNWTGVGIGNFVGWFMEHESNLPKTFYQPAHNIYLLIYSETGIFGIASFLAFLFFILKGKKNMAVLLLAGFLLLGMFDHFLWTLESGRIMFWLILSLV